MNTTPLFSIVVPVFNEADFLADALQSLAEQEGMNPEVIIQDGASNDGSVAVAEDFVRRYPSIFRLFVEPRSGIGESLDRGFARAIGEIFLYLRANEILLPGTLNCVAKEFALPHGHEVIMGRSACVVDGMGTVGVELADDYSRPFDRLAIWKRGFNHVAHPMLFWRRSLMQRFGRFLGGPPGAVDYDFVCRLGGHRSIHKVNHLCGACLIAEGPAAAQDTEEVAIERLIEISQIHWGNWLSPLRWKCEASYRIHKLHWHELARHHARRGEAAAAGGRKLVAGLEFLKTFLISPTMARGRFRVR